MFRPSVSNNLMGDTCSSCEIWNFVCIPFSFHSFEPFSNDNKIQAKRHRNRNIIISIFFLSLFFFKFWHLATRQIQAHSVHNPCTDGKLKLMKSLTNALSNNMFLVKFCMSSIVGLTVVSLRRMLAPEILFNADLKFKRYN